MPRNNSGVYVPPGTDFPAVPGTTIESTKFNNLINDVSSALTTSMATDGQSLVTQDIPMSGKKFTGVGDGSARSDSATVGQIQNARMNWAVATGAADAITATYAPSVVTLVDGQVCRVRAIAANATTAPTFSPNGLTARPITAEGGEALMAGAISGAGHELTLVYNATALRWELTNPDAKGGTQRFGLLKVGPESAAPWSSATRAVDIGSLSAIFHLSTGAAGVTRNLYTDDDGFNWRYRTTGMAQLLYLGTNGEVSIYTAPSAGGAGTVAGLSIRHNVSNTGVVTFGANTGLHTGNVFHGRVNFNGAAARLPAGWGSTREGVGQYVITHGLGTFNYSIVASASLANNATVTTGWDLNSNFRVSTNVAGVLTDVSFHFALMLD